LWFTSGEDPDIMSVLQAAGLCGWGK
jgi:hypothetical protein